MEVFCHHLTVILNNTNLLVVGHLQKLFLTVSGKEDLDLGPNDLHLDDLLLSGKFDLIAYADPELNLEDKKDMFNEELDLGEPMEEKESGARKADFQVKQETRDSASVAQQPPPQPALVTSSRTPRPPGAEAGGSSQRGSSAVLAKVGPRLCTR